MSDKSVLTYLKTQKLIDDQVVYYKRDGSPPMALLHIELEGVRSEDSKKYSLPTKFSSPIQTRNAGETTSTKASSSNPPGSTGTANKPTATSSSFDFSAMQEVLQCMSGVPTEVNRMKDTVSKMEEKVDKFGERLIHAEYEIEGLKVKLNDFIGITQDFVKAGDFGFLTDEVASQKDRLTKLRDRVTRLEISNSQLEHFIDSLETSIDTLSLENLKQDLLAERLVKFANETKELLSQRINAVHLKLDTHIENHNQDTQKLLEETLAEIKASIDSSSVQGKWDGSLDPTVLNGVHGELVRSVQVCLPS